jgi:hypothetical protein
LPVPASPVISTGVETSATQGTSASIFP